MVLKFEMEYMNPKYIYATKYIYDKMLGKLHGLWTDVEGSELLISELR